MNPHVYMLALLIGSGATCSPSSSLPLPRPGATAFLVKPAITLSPQQKDTNRPRHPFLTERHDHGYLASKDRSSVFYRSPLLTRMHASRGGRGRRRGRRGGGGNAAAIMERPSTAAAEATLAVQHATTEDELLVVAHAHRGVLRPSVLSQALLRIAKPLVQEAKQSAREKLLNDPRLLELFMAASAPVAGARIPLSSSPSSSSPPPSPPSSLSLSTLPQPVTTVGGPEAGVGAEAGGRRALSGPQAADIVWACGLLRWLPEISGEFHGRLAWLVELVARAACSDSGIDDCHVTNVVWALDRMGVGAGAAAAAVPAATRAELYSPTEEVVAEPGDRGSWAGSEAADQLRERVERLPFRAIPSLFEGLCVEDFRKEVAFGRDEILLGGGKVLSESRLTAWQSSGGLPFAYSGKVMDPSPFSPNVLRLRDALYERTGVLYDGVLLNLYETRSSAMRYHSDPDVGTVWTQDTSVVSVGDTRQFALRETLDHSRRHAFYLSSGDCVRMIDGCQRDYQHCIKVAKEDVGARISLVFKQSIAGLGRGASSRLEQGG